MMSTVNWQIQVFKGPPTNWWHQNGDVHFILYTLWKAQSFLISALPYFSCGNLHRHSSIIHRHVSAVLIDWMIDCALGTCIYDPAVAVERRAVLLSCDEAQSPGTHGGPRLSISVTLAWVLLPNGSVTHTAAQHTDIAWTSLSQTLLSHFGTDEHLIRAPHKEHHPPPPPVSQSACILSFSCNLNECVYAGADV